MLFPSLLKERGKAACGLLGELIIKYNNNLFHLLNNKFHIFGKPKKST